MVQVATAEKVRYLTNGKTLIEVLNEHDDGRLFVRNVSDKGEARTGHIAPSQRHRWREVIPDDGMG